MLLLVRYDTWRSDGELTNVWEAKLDEISNIRASASTPARVTWSKSAERDIASNVGTTKAGVLEGLLDHLESGYVVFCHHMDNGDVAFIFNCFVGPRRLYVKLKFIQWTDGERMHVFSAHPNR